MTELLLVEFSSAKEYDLAIENGIYVEGEPYTRLLTSANQVKNGTIFFIKSSLYNEVNRILVNNANLEKEMVLAKLNAYYALSATATHIISDFEKVLLVKDYEFDKERYVDWVSKDDEQNLQVTSNIKKNITTNAFDGMGIINISSMVRVKDELNLDYTPSCIGVRHSFLKGMLCCMDIDEYVKYLIEQGLIKNNIIKDAWGNDFDISNGVDVILTTSMLKLWDRYDSWEQYNNSCKENGLNWGIFKTTPKIDEQDLSRRLNYQFIQALNLTQDDIIKLCEPTNQFLHNISGLDVDYSLIYLMGNLANKELPEDNKFNLNNGLDVVTKSLMLNRELIDDPFVSKHLIHSIEKLIEESYIGRIFVDGAYFMMVSDPLALLEYVFLGAGKVKGALSDGEHYCNYFNSNPLKDNKEVAAFRSPMTHFSEVNRLHLIKNELTEKWYKYLDSGCVVYNIHGNDCMIHADSDWDTDSVLLTNNNIVINGIRGGLPITYEKNQAPKDMIDFNSLHEVDKKAFGNNIGTITNIATSYMSMLPLYDVESDEYLEIQKRIKLCRYLQGCEIDKAKGIVADTIPPEWEKIQEINENMSNYEKTSAEFNNKLIASRHPYFFRYRYSKDKANIEKYNFNHNENCLVKFGMSINDMIISADTKEKIEYLNDIYFKFYPLIRSDSEMNRLCRHMELATNDIKPKTYKAKKLYSQMFTPSNSIDYTDKNTYNEKIIKLLKEYCKHLYDIRRNHTIMMQNENLKGNEYISLEKYCSYLKQEVIGKANEHIKGISEQELSNYAIYLGYVEDVKGGSDLLWRIFGDGLIKNIVQRTNGIIKIPVRDENGSIEYLGSKYAMMEVELLIEK